MATAPTAATITIPEAIKLLDGPFATFAAGVAEDRYAFWLGSGISLGRVEGLPQVVGRVIEFVRQQIRPGVHDCKFLAAINRIFALASLSPEERARVDLTRPFREWTDAAPIARRLSGNYSRLLDVQVEGEPEDYLLWSGVDIPTTFGASTTDPDVEHLCVAILILEGVASDIASANWDGLIERATDTLSAGQPTIVVGVRQEDLRKPALRSRLFKFHGCAVLAASDETNYRPYLVGRQSQINSWLVNPANAAMVNRLVDLIVSKPTVMLGLSTQDANIQTLFAKAQATMSWPWPGERPAYAFSEDDLGPDQTGLLQNVYRSAFTTATREQILAGSLIKAYAKALLLSLVLHVLCSKLQRLIELSPGTLGLADRARLQDGVIALRDTVAAAAEPDRLGFVKRLVDHSGHALSLFRDGNTGTPPRPYIPLVAVPTQQISGDAGISASGAREVAVAASILGTGLRDGLWAIKAGDPFQPADGVVHVVTGSRTARVVFAVNSHTALRLRQNGHIVDDGDMVVIYSLEIAPTLPRSPRSAPGRTGHVGLRQVSVTDLLGEVTNCNELLQRFREEVAI